MKKLILVAVIGLFFSCEKNDEIPKNELSVLTTLVSENGLSYSESLDNWSELKNNNGNSYIYQTAFFRGRMLVA
jgi:hypothetical protein